MWCHKPSLNSVGVGTQQIHPLKVLRQSYQHTSQASSMSSSKAPKLSSGNANTTGGVGVHRQIPQTIWEDS